MAAAFGDELREAGVDGTALMHQSWSASAAIDALARGVFERWVGMVARRLSGAS